MPDEVRAVLDTLAAAFPPVETLTPEQARAEYAKARAARPQAEPTPIAAVTEHAIPVADGTIAARLYHPLPDTRLPVLVFAHGGGFVLGDLDSHDQMCRTVARDAQIAVFSVDYRLAPEQQFPTPLEDLDAAALWLEKRAERLSVDPNRVAIGGDSAGGNLAAAAAVIARDRGHPRYSLQWLIYPALDPSCTSASHREYGNDYFLTSAAMRWYWSHYLTRPEDARDPRAAPCLADLRDVAPAFVCTAAFDPLRDEGEAYVAALARAGVPATLFRADGLFHGFFGLGHLLTAVRDANAVAIESLRAALHQPRSNSA